MTSATSHDRQPVEVGEQLDPLTLHSCTADADEPAPWPPGLQGHDQARGVLITGSLAREYEDRRVRALAQAPQNRKPRYQIAARSAMRRIASRRGDQPAL